MITKEYLQQELQRRIDGFKPGVETTTDLTIGEMKSILVLVDALNDYEYEKEYKSLVAKVKKAHQFAQTDSTKNVLEDILPELRESEDERIRAVILKLVLGMRDEIFTTADKLVTKPKVLAWLKKQKEQKPISSCDIVPYIDDKIAALQDMWREEKVSFDWDDLKDMIEDVARHFAKWGAEHLADARKTSPKDLEEAADEYEKKHTYQRYDGSGLTPEYNATLAEAVIFGAEWQKEQDNIISRQAEAAIIKTQQMCYEKGQADMKRQMMKEAVEAHIYQSTNPVSKIGHQLHQAALLYEDKENAPYLKAGDKVKLIIVKED